MASRFCGAPLLYGYLGVRRLYYEENRKDKCNAFVRAKED